MNATRALAAAAILFLGLAACEREAPEGPAPAQADTELTFACMADDAAPAVLPGFAAEHGMKVKTATYETPEEAAQAIRRGEAWDVVVLEPQFLPGLVAEGLLAEIEYRNVPNSKNVSDNFRDLSYDPGNRHAVPYSFGTTGLIVRSDLAPSVRRWSDLWNPGLAGQIAVREQMRELTAIALLSLGHPPNSEDPEHLEEALARLIQLGKAATFVGPEAGEAVPGLLNGNYVVLQGWAEDYRMALAGHPSIAYVLPEEGTLLWYDVFAVPSRSRHRREAERLIDYLLRPEVSARIASENGYASANAAALPSIKPEVRDDPIVYPPVEQLRQAHVYSPLSPVGEELYARIWKRFKDSLGTAAGTEPEK